MLPFRLASEATSLMAGASYCVTDRVKLDVGYRYSHIQGGRMFEFDASSAGPGFDHGFDTHEVRGGLRYQFGTAPVIIEISGAQRDTIKIAIAPVE